MSNTITITIDDDSVDPLVVLTGLTGNLVPGALSVDFAGASKLTGLSISQLRMHTRLGDLEPRFSGTKPVIQITELTRFVEALPRNPKALPSA